MRPNDVTDSGSRDHVLVGVALGNALIDLAATLNLEMNGRDLRSL